VNCTAIGIGSFGLTFVGSVALTLGSVLGIGLVRVAVREVHHFVANLNVMMADAGSMEDGPKHLPYPRKGYHCGSQDCEICDER
jgi:hypothetical protein